MTQPVGRSGERAGASAQAAATQSVDPAGVSSTSASSFAQQREVLTIQHAQAIELQRLQTEREVAVAKEQTQQTRLRFVVGASLAAFITLTGSLYKAWSEANAADAKLALEKEQADAKLQLQRLAYAHEKMSEAVEHFDNALMKAPILRFLAKPEDDAKRLASWAQDELETVNKLVEDQQKAVKELQKEDEVLFKLSAELKELRESDTKTEELERRLAEKERAAQQAREARERAKRALENARQAASPSSKSTETPSSDPVIELAVVQLYSDNVSVRRTGHATLTTGEYRNDPRVIDALWAYIQTRADGPPEGLLNSVRVLAQTSDHTLAQRIDTVRLILEQAKRNGPKTSREAGQVLERLDRLEGATR